jgi:ribA/ribD-fused uncharacterized protein
MKGPPTAPSFPADLEDRTADLSDWPTEDVVGPFRDEYSFLSNFHEAPVGHMGRTYPTAEHAYQAEKAKPMSDLRDKIATADSPKKAKRLGQEAALPEDWEDIKDSVMLEVVTLKFTQNLYLAERLIQTDGLIVELNNWGDVYWGANSEYGNGQNILGRILMGLRSTLENIYS